MRIRHLVAVLALLASCQCAAPAAARPQGLRVRLSDDLKLDADQVLVCAFVLERQTLVCMSVEEAQVRMEAAEPAPDIERKSDM